jgi:hypothetical protein
MKTPAIVASLTVVCSIAYAAGSQGVSGKQSPVMPSESQAHSTQEEMPQTRMAQMAGGCLQGADKNWFTIFHPLPVSCKVGRGSMDAADINQDGSPEFLLYPDSFSVLTNGQPVSGCGISVNEVSGTGDNCSITTSCVIRKETIGQYVKTVYPQASAAYLAWTGVRDMDGDGDLDLVMDMSINSPSPPNEIEVTVWIENTDLQHTARLTGDINGDRKVNGADLGLVLSNWQE